MNSYSNLSGQGVSSLLNHNYKEPQSHRIKDEIYNPFQTRQQDQAIWKATQDRHQERQTERLTTPLFQKTGLVNDREQDFKPQMKSTQYSNQPSMVFDMSNARALKEIQFRPTCQMVQEPGQNSDHVYKQQLKTSDLPSRGNLFRNVITEGDPKSEYNRKPTVRKENMPKNQFTLG